MINLHTATGATAICAFLLFVGWVILKAWTTTVFYGGRRAFFEGEVYNDHWSAPRRAGWNSAWTEHLAARRGQRGLNGPTLWTPGDPDRRRG